MKMKVSEAANNIINAALPGELKNLQTLKTVCNSDSAFVASVKKYQTHQKLLQKAFLLSRTWQKLGMARTWKITLKALQAALQALVSGFKRRGEFATLPEVLQKQAERLIRAHGAPVQPV
jgi:hypothetical protein